MRGRDMDTGAVSVRLHGKDLQGVKPQAEVVAVPLAAIRERRAWDGDLSTARQSRWQARARHSSKVFDFPNGILKLSLCYAEICILVRAVAFWTCRWLFPPCCWRTPTLPPRRTSRARCR